jgi:hypothetical protein
MPISNEREYFTCKQLEGVWIPIRYVGKRNLFEIKNGHKRRIFCHLSFSKVDNDENVLG